MCGKNKLPASGLLLLVTILVATELQGRPQDNGKNRAGSNLLWEFRYNGPGSMGNSDIGKGLCVGSDGNVYCTGQASVNTGSGSDLVIVSMEPDGTFRWDFRYDAGNGFDTGYSIAADRKGNVYAAGDSALSSGDSDFTVVSVDSAGRQRWVYRYDGGARDMDSAFAITVGPDGNIYAGGICTANTAISSDMFLVSLAPDGTERWKQRYNGPANHGDAVWDVTVGGDGNVYICGKASMSSRDDFVVLSFTPTGQYRWGYVYNGTADNEDAANRIIWGGDDNLYIVGKSSETGRSRDLAVVSLTPAGQERWVYLYNGKSNVHDVGHCITFGHDGNLYVGGKTVEPGGDAFSIISLTTAGTERWKWLPTWNGYNGVFSIATDTDSNVYACGWMNKPSGNPRFLHAMGIASTTSTGQERWKLQYNDPDTLSGVCDELVFVKNSGALYTAGMTNGTSGGVEFTILCLDADPIPDVTLGLTPHNPPIVIPATGGTFGYTLTISNKEPQTQSFDAWIDVTLPNSNIYPLLGPFLLTMNPGGTAFWNLNQYVPPLAPAGFYSLNASVGDHPGKVWSKGSFTFEKR